MQLLREGGLGRKSKDTSVRRRSTIEPPVAVPFYAFRVVRARRSEIAEDTI
jgi:hypothetical protein